MAKIKIVVQALNTLHWKTDYKHFCEILNLDESQYSLEKYRQFENLCESLNNFDNDSLTKLIVAGVAAELK